LAAAPTLSSETAIRSLLDEQAARWNRGDLEGYLGGYEKSDELTFFAGGTPSPEGGRRRSIATGPATRAVADEMGTLTFTDVTVEVLGPDVAIAEGAGSSRSREAASQGPLHTRAPKAHRGLAHHPRSLLC